MSTTRSTGTIFVPTVEEVPRIQDSERAELLASLEAARADIAAGHYDVLGPDTLRREFAAILDHEDISDEELNALLGIAPPSPG